MEIATKSKKQQKQKLNANADMLKKRLPEKEEDNNNRNNGVEFLKSFSAVLQEVQVLMVRLAVPVPVVMVKVIILPQILINNIVRVAMP